MKQIVILGAGLSGLTSGWYLHKKWGDQIKLTLIEKTDRVGGWIRSIQQEGFLFEQGPRGFRPKQLTLDLIKELGLKEKLIGADRSAKKRYLLLNGQLHRFSLGLLLRHGLLQSCFHKTPLSSEDETIAHFCNRCFSSSFTETIVDPIVKGIFGGEMRDLSYRSCFPTLWEWEKQKGSILRGWLASRRKSSSSKVALYSFKEGMELLPKTIAAKLPASILLSTAVQALEKKDKGFLIHLNNRTIEADCVISALPAHTLADIFPPIKSLLTHIPFATLSVVNLGWHGKKLAKPGYGFLVPSKEREDIMGMTWDSSIFPDQNRGEQIRLTTMIRGNHPHNELLTLALEKAAIHLQLSHPPDETLTRVAHLAIPQYPVGHKRHLNQLEEALPQGMYLVGNSFYGVGVNDCIMAAATLSTKFLNPI